MTLGNEGNRAKSHGAQSLRVSQTEQPKSTKVFDTATGTARMTGTGPKSTKTSATAFLFACGLAQAIQFNTSEAYDKRLGLPVHVKGICENNKMHYSRAVRELEKAGREFHAFDDAATMNEGLKSGVIPVHHVHADIFDGTAAVSYTHLRAHET